MGFWAMVSYHFGRWRSGVRPALLRKAFSLLFKVLYKLVQIVTGIELPREVQVGKNFVIDHHGEVNISGYAQFGDNCRIRTGVVIGLTRVSMPYAPIIGNNVMIGVNTVVIRDAPNDCIAVGVPSQVRLRSKFADSR